MRCSERLDRFIGLITLENGKGYADAKSRRSMPPVLPLFTPRRVSVCRDTWATPASGARTLVHAKPAGIALLITPWNYPAAMAARKIAPALAAGCTMLIKPASETPLTMLELARLLDDAGVPPGVVNMIPTRWSGAVVESVLADRRVRVLSFTGSTEVGRKLLGVAAQRWSIRR